MELIIGILIYLGVITTPAEYVGGMENCYQDEISAVQDEFDLNTDLVVLEDLEL